MTIQLAGETMGSEGAPDWSSPEPSAVEGFINID